MHSSLSYTSYLRLDQILSAQHPVGPPDAGPQVQAAEQFFIIQHQSFELWMKQFLLDMQCATDALPADSEVALDHLSRAGAIQRLLGLRGDGGSPVYRAFLASLEEAGLSLEELYREPSRGGALYRVAEALVDISEGFWQLCAVHVQTAERTIGRRPGTGGTAGVAYLAEGLSSKAFPQLWDVRTRL
jgi:tryptophan 2,3-dioxygenase